MQQVTETRPDTTESTSRVISDDLSDRLNAVAQQLSPKRFHAQFGTRFNTLLGATGIDWSLEDMDGFQEAKVSDDAPLQMALNFSKRDKLLLLTPVLPGLPDRVINAVLDTMEVTVKDWLHTLEVTTANSDRSANASNDLDGDSFGIQPTSSSKHLPPFLPARFVHKLRNYLTPIISGIGQLQELARMENAADQLAMAEIVAQGAQSQELLLQRFSLTYGPVEIQRAQIDHGELLRSIFSNYRSQGHRSIEFTEPTEEVLCYQDDNLLRIIYREVIDNALEAAGERPITISFSCNEKTVALQVINPASTTVEEIEKHFFTPFYSRKSNHNGLGLTLARRLARELDGDLRCSTSADSVCFEIETPRNLK